MIEDILTYRSGNHLAESFSELLAADLDDDARLLYVRMAADLETVAAGIEPPFHRARIVRMLLVALVAEPPAREAYWRHLYREISALVAGSNGRCASAEIAGDRDGALERLRRFLRENLDLADALAIERLERTALGRSVGA